MDLSLNSLRAKIAKAISNPYPKFPKNPRALVRSQLGRSGQRYSLPGYIYRDQLPELQGKNYMLVLEEMGTNDSTIGAVLNAFTMFLRRPNWHVDPVDDRNKDNGSAEFLESCMSDMQHSWQTFIATAARPTLQFGFSVFEKIFKLRQGDADDDRYSSSHDDGAIGWADFAFRAPETVSWDYDPQDVTRLLGLTQLEAPDYRSQFIPIEKLVLIRADPGRDSPEGRSILRTAWRSWRTKKYMEDFRNAATEMGGTGIPYYEVPANIASAPTQMDAVAGLDSTNPAYIAASDALATYQSPANILESIGLGSQKWVITPQIPDNNGQPTIKLGFLQPSQNGDLLGHITETIETESKAILIGGWPGD